MATPVAPRLRRATQSDRMTKGAATNTRLWWLHMPSPLAKTSANTARRESVRSTHNHSVKTRATNMALSPNTSALVACDQTSEFAPNSAAARIPAQVLRIHDWTTAHTNPPAAAVDKAESKFTRQAGECPSGSAAKKR